MQQEEKTTHLLINIFLPPQYNLKSVNKNTANAYFTEK